MPISLLRKVWLLLCAAGVLVAVVCALAPVRVDFSDDPLLRLRQLDPQLSPPPPTADCGSPISQLNVDPQGTRLDDLARAHACEHAARRRVAVGAAGGLVLVVAGLLGRLGPRVPRPSLSVAGGLPSKESNVGGAREHPEPV